VITGAALAPSPPLLCAQLTGRRPVLPELRAACAQVVARLLGEDPEVVVVVGPAAETGAWDPSSQLNLAAFAPPVADTGTHLLPLALGLGAMLLDQAGYAGPRRLQAIGQHEPAGECAELGADLAGSSARTALLVMGDGSARRGLKAPGYLDARAAGFDADVERAVRAGDSDALLRLDPALARDLMVSGRPAWQVLAGALLSAAPAGALPSPAPADALPLAAPGEVLPSAAPAEVLYCDDPFGVAYLVAYLPAR
jgi:hypothetical protein